LRIFENKLKILFLEKPNLILSLKKNNLNDLFPFAKFCEDSARVTKTQNVL
jgi:hypothetical protein